MSIAFRRFYRVTEPLPLAAHRHALKNSGLTGVLTVLALLVSGDAGGAGNALTSIASSAL
jgi:hypothetical protein